MGSWAAARNAVLSQGRWGPRGPSHGVCNRAWAPRAILPAGVGEASSIGHPPVTSLMHLCCSRGVILHHYPLAHRDYSTRLIARPHPGPRHRRRKPGWDARPTSTRRGVVTPRLDRDNYAAKSLRQTRAHSLRTSVFEILRIPIDGSSVSLERCRCTMM